MTDQIARTATGLVISSVRDKTITVIIERTIKHPLYKKILRRSTKIQAHDQENQCEDGDLVTIKNAGLYQKLNLGIWSVLIRKIKR